MKPIIKAVLLWTAATQLAEAYEYGLNTTRQTTSFTSTTSTTPILTNTSSPSTCTKTITFSVGIFTWVIASTITYINATIIPHITPYQNGTNVTSFENITPTSPPPSVLRSITRPGGFTCVAPSTCVYSGSVIPSIGSGTCAVTIITPESITALALLETPYTAAPEIEPTFTPPTEQPPSSPAEPPPDTQTPGRPSISQPPPVTQEPQPPTQTQEPQPPTTTSNIPPEITGPLISIPNIGPISFASSGPGVLLPSATDVLEPGEVTTINGIAVSLQSQGTAIIVGSQTFNILPLVSALPTGVSALPSGSEIVLPNGQTLTPGVLTTINGVPVSLAPGETQVVVNGSTIALTTSAPGGAGSHIWSGIGGTNTSTAAQFTGGVRDRIKGCGSGGLIAFAAGLLPIIF